MTNRNDDPAAKPPEVSEASLLFTQENDSCDDGDLGQDLRVEIADAGAGPYFIIKTERWAFDSIDELVALLRQAEALKPSRKSPPSA